jgi:hypothetical protein
MNQAEIPMGYDGASSRSGRRDEMEAVSATPKPGAKIKWGYGNLTIEWIVPASATTSSKATLANTPAR